MGQSPSLTRSHGTATPRSWEARRAIEGNGATLHRFRQATIALGATDPPRKLAVPVCHRLLARADCTTPRPEDDEVARLGRGVCLRRGACLRARRADGDRHRVRRIHGHGPASVVIGANSASMALDEDVGAGLSGTRGGSAEKRCSQPKSPTMATYTRLRIRNDKSRTVDDDHSAVPTVSFKSSYSSQHATRTAFS
jgi:hypothetical protein